MADGIGRSGRTRKSRNFVVGPLEKSLGFAEGGLAAYLGSGFEGGRADRLGLGSREAQPGEKFPGQSQGRAVHEVLRATLQIAFNGSTAAHSTNGRFSTQRLGLDWARSAPF